MQDEQAKLMVLYCLYVCNMAATACSLQLREGSLLAASTTEVACVAALSSWPRGRQASATRTCKEATTCTHSTRLFS